MKDPLDEFSVSDPFKTWWPFFIAIIVGIITTIRAYFGGTDCPSDATINGKTVLITGGSHGIGLQVVLELLKRGGKVIIGSRYPKATEEILKKAAADNKINSRFIIKKLDLSSLKSVREFVNDLADEAKIDVLINNAGIAFQDFRKTEEGFESHLVVNYLSHFLLTHLLLPKLKKSEGSRIINVSAQAHYVGSLNLDDLNLEFSYTYNKAFGQSKLALVMMTRHMAKILQGTPITINAMHPGLVRGTKQFQKSPLCSSFMMKLAVMPWTWLFMKSPKQGAQTIIYLAVAPELQTVSGKYFKECSMTEPSEKALDDIIAEKLYRKSLQLTGLSTE